MCYLRLCSEFNNCGMNVIGKWKLSLKSYKFDIISDKKITILKAVDYQFFGD